MIIWEQSSNFTRPSDTTAYAANDLVANSTTAGSVTPLSWRVPGAGNVFITRAKLVKSDATPTNASFTLHIFKNSPTVANGDNGAISYTESGLIGTIALNATTSQASDDTVINATFTAPGLAVDVDADGLLYGLLEAEAAYTPASAEVFTITLAGTSE